MAKLPSDRFVSQGNISSDYERWGYRGTIRVRKRSGMVAYLFEYKLLEYVNRGCAFRFHF